MKRSLNVSINLFFSFTRQFSHWGVFQFLDVTGLAKRFTGQKDTMEKPERTFWPTNISLVDNILRAKGKEEADVSRITFPLIPLFAADVPGAESVSSLAIEHMDKGSSLCLWVRGDQEHFQSIFLRLVSSALTSNCWVYQEFCNINWFPSCWVTLLYFKCLYYTLSDVTGPSASYLQKLFDVSCLPLSPLPFSSFLQVYSYLYSYYLLVFQEVRKLETRQY